MRMISANIQKYLHKPLIDLIGKNKLFDFYHHNLLIFNSTPNTIVACHALGFHSHDENSEAELPSLSTFDATCDR